MEGLGRENTSSLSALPTGLIGLEGKGKRNSTDAAQRSHLPRRDKSPVEKGVELIWKGRQVRQYRWGLRQGPEDTCASRVKGKHTKHCHSLSTFLSFVTVLFSPCFCK